VLEGVVLEEFVAEERGDAGGMLVRCNKQQQITKYGEVEGK
jgi:hypothetical protein